MPVKVPKAAWWVAGIGGGGALIYAYFHNKSKAAQAATASSTQATGNTGYAYGSYGYGAYGYGAYTYAPNGEGYGYGAYGLGEYNPYGYGIYNAGVGETGPAQATTNAQWVQAAMTALTTESVGYSGSQVLAALGLYTTGQPVSAAQEQIISDAIGAEGYPPVPGANGYPPNINVSGTSTTGTPTGGGSTAGNGTPPTGLSVTPHAGGVTNFAWSGGTPPYTVSINAARGKDTGTVNKTLQDSGTHLSTTLPPGYYNWSVASQGGASANGRKFRAES
jgi:hypothetical protein